MGAGSRPEAFLGAIHDVYRGEGRPDADVTATALLASGKSALNTAQPACGFDAQIRALLAGSLHPAAAAILAAQARIPWGTNPVADKVGADFGAICAVATLMGPEGPVPNGDFRLGLFFQRPNSYYALHSHAAVETYVILAGQAIWTAGDDVRLRGTGAYIHHPSLLPHAFQTGPEGIVALWRWSGDIDTASYRMLDDPRALAG